MVSTASGKTQQIEQTWATLSRVLGSPALLARVREASGITLHRSALITLWRLATDGPQLVSELALRAGVDISTMSRLLRQLEQDGFVKRERHGDDLRRVEIRITDRGLDVHRRVSEAGTAILAQVIQDWSQEDCDAFAQYLVRFTDGFIRQLEYPSRG